MHLNGENFQNVRENLKEMDKWTEDLLFRHQGLVCPHPGATLYSYFMLQ